MRSETVYAQAGAYALTVMTTLRSADLPVELHSTYVGHPGARTHARHLRLGPEAHVPAVDSAEHADDDICLVFTLRNAIYDHAHELVEFFGDLGYRVGLQLDDSAFRALEAVGVFRRPQTVKCAAGDQMFEQVPRRRDEQSERQEGCLRASTTLVSREEDVCAEVDRVANERAVR